MYGKWEGTGQEAVNAYFMILNWHLPKKNCKKSNTNLMITRT